MRSRALIAVAVLGSASCLTPTATGARPATDVPRRDDAIALWDGARTPRYHLNRIGPLTPWNGGWGWASCDGRPACRATFGVIEGAGFEGDRGLRFHGEGRGWIGGGWNWANGRADLARDLSRFTKLTFQVRIQAPAAAASQLAELAIALSSTGAGPTSASVRIGKYEPAFLDGNWHKVTIPLPARASTNAGPAFDLSTVQELRISTWSATPVRFDIDLDQIGAER